MMTGFLSSLPMTASKWSAISPIDLPARTSGCSLASSTVSGSSGHPGVSGRVAGVFKQLSPTIPATREQPQPVHEDDWRPSGPFAASTSRSSSAVIVDMTSFIPTPLP